MKFNIHGSKALTDQIVADGGRQCIGLSVRVTGWPATDWVEDYDAADAGTIGL
jgi:hypothetical protein